MLKNINNTILEQIKQIVNSEFLDYEHQLDLLLKLLFNNQSINNIVGDISDEFRSNIYQKYFQHLNELQLHSSEFFRLAPIPQLFLDNNLNIIDINPAAKQFLNLDNSKFLNFSDFISFSSIDAFSNHVYQLEDKTACTSLNIQLLINNTLYNCDIFSQIVFKNKLRLQILSLINLKIADNSELYLEYQEKRIELSNTIKKDLLLTKPYNKIFESVFNNLKRFFPEFDFLIFNQENCLLKNINIRIENNYLNFSDIDISGLSNFEMFLNTTTPYCDENFINPTETVKIKEQLNLLNSNRILTFFKSNLDNNSKIVLIIVHNKNDDLNVYSKKLISESISDCAITQRYQQALIKSQENETKFKILAENLPNSTIAILDENYIYTAISGNETEKLGFEKSFFNGKKLYAVLPPNIWNKVKPVCQSALEGYDSNVEFFYDNQFYNFHAMPFTDEITKQNGFITVTSNITDQKIMENQLRESISLLASVIEYSYDGIYYTDVSGVIINWNKANEKIYSFTASDMIGQYIWDFKYFLEPQYNRKNEIYENIKNELSLLLHSSKANGISIEKSIESADGEWKTVQSVMSSISTPKGTCLLEISRDVTKQHQDQEAVSNLNKELELRVEERTLQLEDALSKLSSEIVVRKFAEERLLKAKEEINEAYLKEKQVNEIKGKFISMISHEYKTPLTVIQSSAEFLKLYFEKCDKDNFEKHVVRIFNSIDNLIELVNEVLVLARLDSENQLHNAEHINLNDFFISLIDEVKIGNKNKHEIRINSFDNCVYFSDPIIIRHIFINLLVNAAKYSPGGQDIEIKIEETNKHITVKISDKGIGISETDLQYLFTPFFRAKNVGNIEGTGFGLSIVKSALESIKGTIDVKTSLNMGSTFTVSLPK